MLHGIAWWCQHVLSSDSLLPRFARFTSGLRNHFCVQDDREKRVEFTTKIAIFFLVVSRRIRLTQIFFERAENRATLVSRDFYFPI